MKLYEVKANVNVDFTFPVIAADEEELDDIVSELTGAAGQIPDPELAKQLCEVGSFVKERFYGNVPDEEDDISFRITTHVVKEDEFSDESCENTALQNRLVSGKCEYDLDHPLFIINPEVPIKPVSEKDYVYDMIRSSGDVEIWKIPDTECALVYSKRQIIESGSFTVLLGNAFVVSKGQPFLYRIYEALKVLDVMNERQSDDFTDGEHVFPGFDISK